MALAFNGRKVETLGISHDLAVIPNTGEAVLTVPIPAPPGRGDLTPALALRYSSSLDNSAFGAGWSLSGLPSVTIDVRKRLPRWDGTDTLALAGDELVPWLQESAGEWRPRERRDGEWSIVFLRRRLKSLHLRVEQWTHAPSGRVHFRVRDASGAVTIFGARPSAAGRIADPDDEHRTFAWLPELQLDGHGNALWFEYAPETVDGIDFRGGFERRRPSLAQRYLKRIRYGNVVPVALDQARVDGALPPIRWCFQLVFDYGDHADQDRPAAEPDRAWPPRPDPFTSCRPGFEVRTWRLCRRILSFHEFDELGPGPTITGALVLSHDENATASTLREIAWVGHRRDGATATSRAVPPLRLTYAQPMIESAFLDAPVETQENLPVGLAGPSYAFVDLFGEGLPGILSSMDRAWYYKPNLGGGRFAAQALLEERPSADADTHALGDLDSDGDTDYSQVTGRLAGYFELARDQARWSGHRAFEALPHLEAFGGRAHWMDMNGDGRPDVVLATDDRLVWFPSDGDRFGDPVDIPLPDGAAAAPSLAADPQLDFFFADMNGDGLADLVRVENARVRYWPSLGNGRFGDAIELETAGPFAADEEFDSGRIRFVDLDGTGAADLVYVGRGEVRTMINAGGNRLLPGPRLSGLPYIDNVSSVRVLDFLGDGRPCLVWSSPVPSGHAACAYLPLAPAVRPRLLLEADNSLGRRTRLTWSTSASHYLRDRREGRSWSTRLPFHHPVVDAQEVVDDIAETRSVTRFAFHDGHYDGEEREERGFGQVEIYDDEVGRGSDAAGGAAPAARSMSRTWFHLGGPTAGRHVLPGAYGGDPDLPALAPQTIDDAAGLLGSEVDDALRSAAGEVLRREVYALDERGQPLDHPFEVHQASVRVRRGQPARGAARAAFTSVVVESLTAAYEATPDDPRVTHTLIATTDAFDQIARKFDIGYPRRASRPHDTPAQGRVLVAAQDYRLRHIDEDLRFELSTPIESRAYELRGLRPAAAVFTRAELSADPVVAALTDPAPHHVEIPDDPSGPPRARLVTWAQSFYWDDARTGALQLGDVGAHVIVHHEEGAALSRGLVAEVFGDRVDDARLLALGYRQRDGVWWHVDPTHEYAPAEQFSQRVGLRREDGVFMRLEYDVHALATVATVDAVGNRIEAEIDYHALAARRITDPNGNASEVRYDPLGVVVCVANNGHVGDQPWGSDRLAAVVDRAPTTLAEALADPGALIQGAASYFWYDLDAWRRDRSPTTQLTLVREELPHDGEGGGTVGGRIQTTVRYLDGFGRSLQHKTLVEPGPAIQRDAAGVVVTDPAGRPILGPAAVRWRASGHVAYDAKQRVGRVYQPYFSPSFAFEGDDVLQRFGASTLTEYDALGRVVKESRDDGIFTRTVRGAWATEQWDANDTVLESIWRIEREGFPADHPERQALEHAKAHAGTFHSSFVDPLGREVAALARGGGTAEDQRTEQRVDIRGRAVEVVDARGLVAFAWQHDMQGRAVLERSVDAGESRALPDGHGRVAVTWDARGFEIEHAYDALDRLVLTHVRGGDGAVALDHRVHERVYGETVADAAARNLRGRIAIARDGAGEVAIDRYDPAGRATSATCRFRAETAGEPDWRGAVALESDAFTEAARFDALGRLRQRTDPDGMVRTFEYQAGGLLDRVRITAPTGGVTDVPVLDGATHDARGMREHLRLGNGVGIDMRFDPRTFRLVAQTAQLGQRRLQDIAFTWDAAGFVVRMVDEAQQGADPIIAGATAPARRDFAYDAHGRLRRATGRVHQALLEHDYVPGAPGTFKGSRYLSLNNGAAIELFTRTYEYDVSNNLRQMRHVGASQSWTRDYWISAASNRSLPAIDPGGQPVTDPESRFDASGNLRALDHLRGMEWTFSASLSRAVIVERPGGEDDDERYVYGGDGRRVRKITTRAIGGGAAEVVETLYLGATERKRIRHGSETVLERWTSRVTDGTALLAVVHRWTRDDLHRETDQAGAARIHYIVPTHQGSTALLLDQQGAVISYEEYFPYGGTAFIAGNDVREVALKDYRYCGKERDDATGLDYYGHRYYASWLGRWLSPDPVGPKDHLNLYQFVHGDPVGNVDRNGLDTQGGRVVQQYMKPPEPAPDVETRIQNMRAALSTVYRAAFDSLSRADQERFVTPTAGMKLWLVPTDPNRPSGASGWSLISDEKFRTSWLPARVAWSKKQHRDVILKVQTHNPTRLAGLGDTGLGTEGAAPPGKGEAGTGGGGAKTTTGDGSGGGGEGKSASGDGQGGQGETAGGDGTGGEGDGAKETGDGNGKDKAGRDGAGQGARASGADAGGGDGKSEGQGSGGSGPGTGAKSYLDGDLGGDILGLRGGQIGGEAGGTPFSIGHTEGGMGTALQAAAGMGAGSGRGAAGTGLGGQSRDGSRSGDRSQSGLGGGNGNLAPLAGMPTAIGGSKRYPHPSAAKMDRPDAPTGNMTTKGGHEPGTYTAWNVAVDMAGITNFVFEEDRPGGSETGIPGGLGWFGSNRFFQVMYVVTSFIGVGFLAEGLEALLRGTIGLIRGLFRFGRLLLTDLPGLLRLGWRGIAALARVGPRLWNGARNLIFGLRGYLSEGRMIVGSRRFTVAEIIEHFAGLKHNKFSRELLEAIKSGRLEVALEDLPSNILGRASEATRIRLNQAIQLDDAAATIVHEGRHSFDIAESLVNVITDSPLGNRLFSEMRAYADAANFAAKNKLLATDAIRYAGMNVVTLACELADGLPKLAGITEKEIEKAIEAFKLLR